MCKSRRQQSKGVVKAVPTLHPCARTLELKVCITDQILQRRDGYTHYNTVLEISMLEREITLPQRLAARTKSGSKLAPPYSILQTRYRFQQDNKITNNTCNSSQLLYIYIYIYILHCIIARWSHGGIVRSHANKLHFTHASHGYPCEQMLRSRTWML